MKKLLILLITIALASQLAILPASAKIVSKDDHSWKVINGLGLADFSVSQKEEKVTRAEFAKFVAGALGITVDEEKAENGNPSLFEKAFYTNIAYTEYADAVKDSSEVSFYEDVSQNDEAYDAIYALKKLEIMSGDGTGYFHPDKYVKYEEVLKTFVVLASYNVDAKLPGSWSYGYVKLASDLDIIIKGVSQGTEITKQQLLRIFYNLFDVEMIKMIAVVDGNAVYETQKGLTFLNEMIGLYCFDGQLDATANSTVYLPYTTKSNSVVINSITYGDKTRIPLGSMLGREVEAYRTEDGDVVYMTTTDDDEVEVIAADNVNGCVGGVLSYEKNGRGKTTDISGLPVIYNGVAMTSYDETLFDLENGSITLIEKDEQDIISVWNYKDMYSGSVVSAQNAIYDEITGYKLELDSDDSTVHIFNLDGDRLSFEDLTAGKNISYIENGSYKEVYVYDGQIEGVVRQINQGEEQITVEASEYKLTKTLASSLSGLSVGTNITAYINMFGEIFYIEQGKTVGENMGYIVRAYLNDDEEPMVRMYCKDGEFIEYHLYDKVNFTDPENNSTKPDGTSLVQIINGNSYYDVCTFYLNTDEYITKIQMALKSKSCLTQGEDKLYKKYFNMSDNSRYEKNTGIVSYSLFLTAAVKIYEIPADKTDYENYNVLEFSELANSSLFNGYAYYMDDGIPVPRALVIEPLAPVDNIELSDLKLVTKVGNQFVDEEDRVCVEAEFVTVSGTKSTSYCVVENGISEFDNVSGFAQESTHRLGVGDLVFCNNKPNSNELSIIRLIYSADLASPAGQNAKKGWFPDFENNLFRIKKTEYDKFKANANDEDLMSYISYNNVSFTAKQNPMKISAGVGRPLAAQPHYAQNASRMMLGYAVDFKDGYLKLTTQDLSVNTYDPDVSNNVFDYGDGSVGVKFERYYNTMRLSTQFYLVEMYDNGIETRKADPTIDILTYKKSGNDCSRVMVFNDLQYFIINDYRTR